MCSHTRDFKLLVYATELALFLSMILSTSPHVWGLGDTDLISTQGMIEYHYQYLLFKSDFQETTPIYPEHLDWQISHLVNTQPLTLEHLAGAFYDIVADIAYSGTKSLYLELSDVRENRRNQLSIYSGELFGSEVFVSVWLFLPSDWNLHSLTNKWYELANPCYPVLDDPQDDLTVRLHINKYGSQFVWRLFASPHGYSPVWDVANSDIEVPRGRWFNLKYYIKRSMSSDEGRVTVWVDGALLFNVTDKTGYPTTFYATVPAKIYHESDDLTTHQLWVDDLELHSTIP